MPYTPKWYNEQRSIIYVDINGNVTWEQWYQLTDKLLEMLSTVDHLVDIIYDDKVGMPKGNPMPHIRATSAKLIEHKNMGLIVSVSPRQLSGFVKAMVDIMMRAYRMDMSHNGGFVDSLEEALKVIQHRRSQAEDRSVIEA